MTSKAAAAIPSMSASTRLIVCTIAILWYGLASSAAAGRDHRLADAVERGDRAVVFSLIRQGADPNGAQADGATALQWAAHADDLQTVELLLRAGAEANAANDHGVTALALACENRSLPIVDRLLRAGANANATVMSGETVLMTAARTGSSAIVEALLAHGAAIDEKEPTHGQTPLMWAIAERHPDVALALIKHGADVAARTKVRRRTVQTGSRYGDQNSIKEVSQVDLGGFTPLLFAARVGDTASAEYLLDAGADVNETAPNGASPLVVAAHSGHGPTAVLLLDRGADPDAAGAGYAALHAAVLRGDTALVKTLLDYGANANVRLAKGTSSRYYSKDFAFNEALVGATPLWLAARFAEPTIVRTLAESAADPTVTLGDGTTALMAAVASTRGFGAFRAGDRRERYLGPADVAAKVEGEEERLTIATAKEVLSRRVDVDARNKDGDTALHMAAALGLTMVVQVLADSGARLDIANNKGLTPLASITASAGRGQGFQLYAPSDDRSGAAELLRKLGVKN